MLSFIYLGIYWNNHHHLLHAVKHVSGKIMWANLHLLFWLSLLPFFTAWLGENHGGTWPTAFYGMILMAAGFSYLLLQTLIIESHGQNSTLAFVFRHDWKGKLSLAGYAAGIALAFINQWISDLIYIGIAAMWLIPERRIESLKD